MGSCIKLVLISLGITGIIVGYVYHLLTQIPPTPKLEDTWWGHGDPAKEDTTIKPFKINIPDGVLQDLNRRLDNARNFIPPLEGAAHHYGINTNLLKEIVSYWRTKYDWRQREKILNTYPQFTVSVQGLKIHYIHVKPTNTKGLRVLPLMILHGWPGSVKEFYGIIPHLTTPKKGRDFVFEVIVPSLPGYGFSEGAVRPGLGAVEMAVVFKNFMKRIGYDKYYLQGGDWGAIIVQHMATLYPDHVLGEHSNMCFVDTSLSHVKLFLGSWYPSLVVDQKYQDRVYPISKKYSHIILETGYMHIQATKPDTIGVGLNDSPVGLAAYIIEKFITWTNAEWKNLADGGLTKKFSYADLLDNVMIYWVTNSITTSVRLYAESFNHNQWSLAITRIPTDVPSACARFKHELLYPPESILKEKYRNLVHVSDFEDGGHFAAFELPDVLAEDIYAATEKFLTLQKKGQNKNEL